MSQSLASQQTPPLHDWPLQLTVQLAPLHLTWPGHAPSAQLTCVSPLALLSIEFWHEGWPLHSIKQELLLPPQLTLPGQLPVPLQRRPHSPASQRTSLMHEPWASQTTSHELPPHKMLPEQLLVPLHCTLQLSASWQSTPLMHEPWLLHITLQGTPAGHFTLSGQG